MAAKAATGAGTDLLGLAALGSLIGNVVQLDRNLKVTSANQRLRAALDELQGQYRKVQSSFAQLVQRYTLLKNANQQLGEELACLREQFDLMARERADLMLQLAEHKTRAVSAPGAGTKARRRAAGTRA